MADRGKEKVWISGAPCLNNELTFTRFYTRPFRLFAKREKGGATGRRSPEGFTTVAENSPEDTVWRLVRGDWPAGEKKGAKKRVSPQCHKNCSFQNNQKKDVAKRRLVCVCAY